MQALPNENAPDCIHCKKKNQMVFENEDEEGSLWYCLDCKVRTQTRTVWGKVKPIASTLMQAAGLAFMVFNAINGKPTMPGKSAHPFGKWVWENGKLMKKY